MKIAARIVGLALLLALAATQPLVAQATMFKGEDFIAPYSLYDPQGMHYAIVFKNGVRFGSNKTGPFELSGQWRGHLLIATDSAGRGDVEIAKILDNGDLQIHAAVFNPADAQDYVLHKVVPGQPPGGVAIAVQPPPPDPGPKLAWPPPKGTITLGMSREALEKLPWRRDGIDQIRDGSRAETYVYTYHCDDPTLLDLTVTVKNDRVVTINGGNG
jgi:hypothetical protein